MLNVGNPVTFPLKDVRQERMSRKNHHPSEGQRTVIWDDPLIGGQSSETLTGLDYLRAMEK